MTTETVEEERKMERIEEERRALVFQTDAERTRFRSRGSFFFVLGPAGSGAAGVGGTTEAVATTAEAATVVGVSGGAGCYFFLAWSISMSSVCEGALPLMCL